MKAIEKAEQEMRECAAKHAAKPCATAAWVAASAAHDRLHRRIETERLDRAIAKGKGA
jgi:hypothetical protein